MVIRDFRIPGKKSFNFLPMTLLLRPFNFETLATQTYQYAHSELMAEASVPALLIIASGLVPVFLMNKLMREI